MTTTTANQAEQAAAIAAARRAADGLPPRTRTSGPMIEMMLEAGFSVDRCRGTIGAMEGLRDDFIGIIGAPALDAWMDESRAAVLAAEGLAVFTVDVSFTTRERDAEGRFVTFWSRATVAAADAVEAEWIGTALVMGQPGREAMDCMPVASTIAV